MVWHMLWVLPKHVTFWLLFAKQYANLLDVLKKIYNYSDKYLTIHTVAMPVVTIEQTSILTPSNCIIP
jgi:hypothetical protein